MKWILILTLSLTFSFAAFAKPKQSKYKKTQEVSFDGQDIDGQSRSPDGAYVNPQKGIKFMPLYKLDKKLEKSIKESVEFVR